MEYKSEKIPIGVSTCLLGKPVRYDGGHAHDHYITDTLGRFFEFIEVCPETEAGLGVPREPMRLVGDITSPRLLTVKTNRDMTERITSWAKEKIEELKGKDLRGFIFKSKSPSSGMERVKVYVDQKRVLKKGVGLFAKAFMEAFPLVPVEEDGRLHDPVLRENFIERVFTFHRWKSLISKDTSMKDLVQFHTRHKFLILSHSPQHYTQMGRLVAKGMGESIHETYLKYGELLMQAMKLKATPKKHTNVLFHMLGYFKKNLTSEDKKELLQIIQDYYHGYLPLIVPITLIKHYAKKFEQNYLLDQFYLNPHPIELKLRNHA